MNNEAIEILLVEDNQYDAELAINALKTKNLANNLYHVEDGVEAIDFIFCRGKYNERNIDIPPRVILLDLKMPKLNGLEVLRQVKADPRTKKIPVVILTSSKEDPDIKEAYELGANCYIVKPVDFDNFSKAVEEIGLFWMLLNQPPK